MCLLCISVSLGYRRSVVSRRTHCEKWRVRGWRIIRTCFWKSHSRNNTFFCFLRSHYFHCFFSYWVVIHPEMKHKQLCFLRADWNMTLCHFRRDFLLSGWNSSTFFFGLVLAFFCFLSKDFTPFWSVSWRRNEIGFESVTTVIKCKQEMISSWSRIFAAICHWGVNVLWGLWRFGSVLTTFTTIYNNRFRRIIDLLATDKSSIFCDNLVQ